MSAFQHRDVVKAKGIEFAAKVAVNPLTRKTVILFQSCSCVTKAPCGLQRVAENMKDQKEKKMSDKIFEVTAVIKAGLTQENIDQIMARALEDGTKYWCCKAEVVEEKRCGDCTHEQIARGGAIILYGAKSSDKWELTLEKFLNGFKLWIENGCDNYGAVEHGQVDDRQIDGQAADMIVQFALFGEVAFL